MHAHACTYTHTHTSQLYITHSTRASLSVTLKFHGGGQLGKKCLKRLLKEEITKNWLRKLQYRILDSSDMVVHSGGRPAQQKSFSFPSKILSMRCCLRQFYDLLVKIQCSLYSSILFLAALGHLYLTCLKPSYTKMWSSRLHVKDVLQYSFLPEPSNSFMVVLFKCRASLVAQLIKDPPAIGESWV